MRIFSGNVAQASLLEILMLNTVFNAKYVLLTATWKVTLH